MKAIFELVDKEKFVVRSIDKNGVESISKTYPFRSSSVGAVKRAWQTKGYQIENNLPKARLCNKEIVGICPVCGLEVYETGGWTKYKDIYYHRLCFEKREG